MKKSIITIVIILIAIVFSYNTTQAQSKIGTIDIHEIMVALPEAKNANDKLKKISNEINKKLVEKENKFQQEIKKFNNEYNKMNKTQRSQYENQLDNLENQLEKAQQDADKQINAKQKELLQPIIKKVQDAVQSVAKAKKYTHILNKEKDGASQVIYALPSTDITNQVKRKLGIK